MMVMLVYEYHAMPKQGNTHTHIHTRIYQIHLQDFGRCMITICLNADNFFYLIINLIMVK